MSFFGNCGCDENAGGGFMNGCGCDPCTLILLLLLSNGRGGCGCDICSIVWLILIINCICGKGGHGGCGGYDNCQ